MELSESEIREKVNREIISDAVEVERNGDITTITLSYFEPESETELVRTPLGVAVAVVQPEMEKVIADLMEDIQSVTSPDRMDVEDRNGFYTIELTYKDGRTW